MSVLHFFDTVASDGNYEAGFGLGALNDAEEDDIDIYDSSISRRFDREIAYDQPAHRP